MDTKEFSATLSRDGYTEISTRNQAPLLENSAHSHPFDVRALMLSGEMTLSYEGKTQVCRAGDVFTMQAGCEHAEKFGPDGASYLAGRRQAVPPASRGSS